jgi:hypothetical protein
MRNEDLKIHTFITGENVRIWTMSVAAAEGGAVISLVVRFKTKS